MVAARVLWSFVNPSEDKKKCNRVNIYPNALGFFAWYYVGVRRPEAQHKDFFQSIVLLGRVCVRVCV